MNRSRIATLLLGAVMALSLALAACGGDDDDASPPASPAATTAGAAAATTYVGRVANSDAFVALLFNGRNVLAYVCDGKQTALWFRGAVGGDGAVNLTNEQGARLEARLTRDAASGTVVIAGQSLSFSGAVATGTAGLYRQTENIGGVAWTGGWVVLPDGQLRGAKRSATGSVEAQTSLGGGRQVDRPDS